MSAEEVEPTSLPAARLPALLAPPRLRVRAHRLRGQLRSRAAVFPRRGRRSPRAASTLTLATRRLGRLPRERGRPSAALFSAGLGYAAVDLSAVTHLHPGVEYLVFLPTLVYLMPIAGRAAGLPPGRTWVSIPLAPSPRVGAAFPRLAEQLEGLNAELLLDEIAWGAAGARHIGEPVIDHLPLSEYLVTVDLRRAAAAAAGPSAAAMRSAISEELAALAPPGPGPARCLFGSGSTAPGGSPASRARCLGRGWNDLDRALAVRSRDGAQPAAPCSGGRVDRARAARGETAALAARARNQMRPACWISRAAS